MNFIAPNIKLIMLPFVLDPNGNQLNSSDSATSTPQIFSFRENSFDSPISNNRAYLNICPTSVQRYFNEDISNQLLYNNLFLDDAGTDQLNFSELCKSLPAIEIREYLPDLKLDQALGIFIKVISGIKSIFQSNKDSTSKDKKSSLFDKLETVFNPNTWRAASLTILTLYDEICNSATAFDINNITFELYKSSKVADMYPEDKTTGRLKYILDFPYTMYYTLQSSLTTNIYELPGITNSKVLYSSLGSAGWLDAENSVSLSRYNMLKSVPLIGSIVDKLLGNVSINYMPWWKPSSGANTKEPKVDVEFDLFNDTPEVAVANFIFVNTLVPGNKWLQYNIIQHSSNLYDIKLNGYNRLFACAADFEVSYNGNLRTPSNLFFKLLSKRMNSSIGGKSAILEDPIELRELVDLYGLDSHKKLLLEALLKRLQSIIEARQSSETLDSKTKALKQFEVIRIPDIYHVKLSFQSLLPSNFNNYLFSISNNTTIKNMPSTSWRQESSLTSATDGINKYIDNIIKFAGDIYEAALEEVPDESQTNMNPTAIRYIAQGIKTERAAGLRE